MPCKAIGAQRAYGFGRRTANEVGDRISQWAAMIQPEAFTTRIASLIGVRPQADPGQPQMLALANHPSVDMLAAAKVEEPVASSALSDLRLPPSSRH